MSRKSAWMIGLFCIGLTAVICGGILLKTWIGGRSVQEEVGLEKQKNQEKKAQEEQREESQEQQQEIRRSPSAVSEEAKLRISENPLLYTYGDLKQDIKRLKNTYEQWITADSIGETVDSRQIYHIVVGDPAAEEKIFINGGIHGREYMTSQLVMKQLVSFLEHLEANNVYLKNSVKSGETASEYRYRDLLKGKAIHVVPMVNPDGISISQYGMKGLQIAENRENLLHIVQMNGEESGMFYLKKWKANARGVDLNRNFDALWESYADPVGYPSSDHYKGTEPGCEVESAALIALTKKEQFSRTISYHAQGSVIYWYFAQEGTLYQETLEFGERISALTGYPMDADYTALDPAGYKDWAISSEKIPSLTIEIGWEESPVPPEQFSTIWKENEFVWEETLLDLMK